MIVEDVLVLLALFLVGGAVVRLAPPALREIFRAYRRSDPVAVAKEHKRVAAERLEVARIEAEAARSEMEADRTIDGLYEEVIHETQEEKKRHG